MDDAPSLLFALSGWMNVLFQLAAAGAAFARLRATPAGLLIGLGFLSLFGLSLINQAMWTFAKRSPDGLDMASVERLGLIDSGTWVCSSIVIAVIAVGMLMIPASLRKLDKARAG